MNQDFALSATPSIARRLLMLQRVCAIEITDEICAMAAQDVLSEQHFDPLVCPYHPVKQAITQFLLDCKLRGIVLADYHPEYNEIALLHTLKLAKVTRIHIVTDRSARWNSAIAALSLEAIVEKSPPFLQLSKDEIDQHRHDTVLLIDVNLRVMHGRIRVLAQEFPQIIVYQPNDSYLNMHTHWIIWADLLFPTMPHPLYVRLVDNVPPAWSKQSLASFAPFYNTCLFPDLIDDPDLLAYLEDDAVLRMLNHSGKLIL